MIICLLRITHAGVGAQRETSDMARTRPGLQKAINEILERHGINGKRLSFRQAERLTGLSPATISELAKGNARTPETLCRFAEGLGEEADRLLLLAGFAEAAEQLKAVAPGPQDELPAIMPLEAGISNLLARYGRALSALPHGRVRTSLLLRLQADIDLLESLALPDVLSRTDD
jgi:transcriptional regulator with XRE-family HTH domain